LAHPSSPFYGYPADLIASWCGVSEAVAADWKEGVRRPSKQARLLFDLYRERRVLGAGWEAWAVNRQCLVDPEGNSTTQQQLRAYAQIVGWCIERSRLDRVNPRISDIISPTGGGELAANSPLLGGRPSNGES
jgi:hypothetical protein